MEEPLWHFEDVPDERLHYLLAPFTFPELIQDICSDVQNVRYEKERGSLEVKGSWRPVFWFDVSERTFDRFFNSPFGYRGQYLEDPDKGSRQNASLLSVLSEHLIQSVMLQGNDIDQVRCSLASPHAKIWIDEKHLNRNTELNIQVCVPTWVHAAKEVYERLNRSESGITTKELSRLDWVTAPLGRTLNAKGGWIGGFEVVSSKVSRALELQSFGGS